MSARALTAAGPAPRLPTLPGPIVGICSEFVPEPDAVRAPRPTPGARGMQPGAARFGALGPCSAEASRHPALQPVARPLSALQHLCSVLLVDDDPHRWIPLVRALREQGHRVLHAADGPSGESLCRASRFEIDALIAPTDMKRMCGCELAGRVVRMRSDVRVLLMWRRSGANEAAHRAHGRGYAVIEEPFTPEELCLRLKGVLGSASNDTFAALRLDTDHRFVPHAEERPAIASRIEDCSFEEIHPWTRANPTYSAKAGRRAERRSCRSRPASGANGPTPGSIRSPSVPPARQGCRRCERWR